MSVFCKELNKEFPTKQDMFKAIKANKEAIIAMKKARIKTTDAVNFRIKAENADKAAIEPKDVQIGDTIYPIINTTNFFDSHGDVHLDGIWDISVDQQKNKLYYIINHDLEIGSVISYPKDTVASVISTTWKALGLPYDGTTQALMFASKLTDKTNKDFLAAVMDNEDLQNSVRMRYISYMLCIDDNDPDFAVEKANFYKYLPNIANKEDVMNAGIYWAVQQAAIEKEGSACLFGSNPATPILYTDPADAGQKQELPPVDTRIAIKSNIHHLI